MARFSCLKILLLLRSHPLTIFAITFSLCQRLIDDYILATEEELRQAIRLFIETHHMLIEGAAGVPLAALLKAPERFQGKTVVVVLCGANLSLETLKTILA